MDDSDSPKQETSCPTCAEQPSKDGKPCDLCRMQRTADLEVERLGKRGAKETYEKYGKVPPSKDLGADM